MNILILGSTGLTGKELIKKGLEKGHTVTALARDPAKLDLADEQLSIIKGDILDSNSIPNMLEGQQAVINALGVGSSLKSRNLIFNAISNLLPEMQKRNIKRLVSVSAFGVGETIKQANIIQRFLFRVLLGNIYADKNKGDEMIRASGLDWTIVYPVLLNNKPFSGHYKTGERLPMKGIPKLSRADLADFLINQLTDYSHIHKSPIIMN